MNPYEAPPPGRSNAKGSPRSKKARPSFTWIELLIAAVIIAVIVAWLPEEWCK